MIRFVLLEQIKFLVCLLHFLFRESNPNCLIEVVFGSVKLFDVFVCGTSSQIGKRVVGFDFNCLVIIFEGQFVIPLFISTVRIY